MIIEEQIQQDDGNGSWRRKGISLVDRRLLSIERTNQFNTPNDFLEFLPDDHTQPFSSYELSTVRKIPRRVATKMLYCFNKMGLIHPIGKNGRSILYSSS